MGECDGEVLVLLGCQAAESRDGRSMLSAQSQKKIEKAVLACLVCVCVCVARVCARTYHGNLNVQASGGTREP